jgi:exodeoxyribonuclease VII large subunit
VIKRRHPRLQILIYPVPVQGAEAAPAIIEAIEHFNREKSADVLIVGRGGGSLEDLWAFNEEAVGRSIASSRIPVISAVGHETDYTIADFVADLRAPTPSAAAEMVVESEEHLQNAIHGFRSRMLMSMRQLLDGHRATVTHAMRLLGDPRQRLGQYGQRVDELMGRLALGLRQHVRRDRAHLVSLSSALEHLNPLGILSRGYSVTKRLMDGAIIKDAKEVKPGDLLSTLLYHGEVLSRVEETRKAP